jgi:pimeloyl-ACP methyl ester carboxylesterase
MQTQTFQLDLNGVKIQFNKVKAEKASNSVPIILLHDSFGCIETWKEFPQQLSNSLHRVVYLYDRQGYGQSDPLAISSRKASYMEDEAHILVQLMDMLEIEKAILFGHSDGATIALLTAAMYPARTEALISEAAHVFVEEITLKGIQQAVYAYNNLSLKGRLIKYHGDKTELLFALWHSTWLNESFRNWNMLSMLEKITAPTLIIQGENDEFGSLQQVTYIEEKNAGLTERFILKDTGHTPHKEKAETVLYKVQSFLSNLHE